jgi:hypothetical protein
MRAVEQEGAEKTERRFSVGHKQQPIKLAEETEGTEGWG